MRTPHSILLVVAAAALVAAAAPAVPLAMASATDQVFFLSGARTRAAWEKGQPLVETDRYKVHASRREAPGLAEVHTDDTDIIYVLDGTATIVTGGTIVGSHEIAAHEIRGSAVDGGNVQRLTKGDVLIVPNGVPHWFTEVQAPFLYYVVKVTKDQSVGGAR
jgi:mannose-6-phosphate isomerase-like protein (cupin superfamily)